jgi:hypothetical protein
MEMRLQMLQERLKQQSELEGTKNTGGNRWKSAKPEKGSIRAYGKEIADKAKKKSSDYHNGTLMSKSTTLPATSTVSATMSNTTPPLKLSAEVLLQNPSKSSKTINIIFLIFLINFLNRVY